MRNAPTSTEDVYALLCALRDTYDYGAINPVLLGKDKLRKALQEACQSYERHEMEEEDLALESWADLDRAGQRKIIAAAKELWGQRVRRFFPALSPSDPDTRRFTDLTDDEFNDFLDRLR